MMLIGLSPDLRHSIDVGSVLIVVVRGKNGNDMLRIIINDVVTAIVDAVYVIDTLEISVLILIHPVAFLHEYPTIVSVSDYLCHVTNAFCTLWNLSRWKGTQCVEVAYLSTVQSCILPSARTDVRLDAIRAGGVHCRLLTRIGMNSGDTEYISELLLVPM